MNILTLDLLDGKPNVSVVVANEEEAARLLIFMEETMRLWDASTNINEEVWEYPWGEAPDWANYAARDADGDQWWYESDLEAIGNDWRAKNPLAKVKRITPNTFRWHESKQARPK